MKVKGQAALEFLVTYGWAFLVILITVGALYYFGIFDFQKYLPEKCTLGSQISCSDFSLEGSEIRMKLTNNLGEAVKVKSLSAADDASSPLACTGISPSMEFGPWEPGDEQDFTLTGCSGGAFLPGSRVDIKLLLVYYSPETPTSPEHAVSGRISGRLR